MVVLSLAGCESEPWRSATHPSSGKVDDASVPCTQHGDINLQKWQGSYRSLAGRGGIGMRTGADHTPMAVFDLIDGCLGAGISPVLIIS